MKEQAIVFLWLQLFTACLLFGVNGKLPLCFCLQFKPPPLTSPGLLLISAAVSIKLAS